MKGLISEGEEIIDATGEPQVKDAARLLESTLDEEKETDRKLTELAEQGINIRAQSV
jgi:ferritin-like metal-binding protein YciE